MIGYTTIGSDNLEHSGAFYDELFALLGATRIMEEADLVAWGTSEAGTMFSIHLPADGKSASIGNGVMIALKAKDKKHVESLHLKALELGGADEGKPGFRSEGFYAAYFRDLDGNKLNVHCMV